ncbi:MAG: hypothetical protein WAU33_10320 [Candidatus Binataceae bacterium]
MFDFGGVRFVRKTPGLQIPLIYGMMAYAAQAKSEGDEHVVVNRAEIQVRRPRARAQRQNRNEFAVQER